MRPILRGSTASVDGRYFTERADHPELLVAGNRADHRVAAGREVDLERLAAAAQEAVGAGQLLAAGGAGLRSIVRLWAIWPSFRDGQLACRA